MRIPGPNDVVKLAGQGYEAAERAMALVPRLVSIVGEVEQLMVRVNAVVGSIVETNQRATQVVERTAQVVGRAEQLVGTAEDMLGGLAPIVDRFVPVLDRIEPMVARIADTTSPDEVDAVVKLIDTLPELSDKLRTDILPVLDTLGTVAPDLRDLLDSSKELNEIMSGLPGLGRVKKRIEERQQQEDAEAAAKHYTAQEVPPSAPARGGVTEPAGGATTAPPAAPAIGTAAGGATTAPPAVLNGVPTAGPDAAGR
jgi:ABC-type transporter Mla subunit MlaD